MQKNEKDSILVLTHTNAGITSIREKFKKESVQTKNVTICTITGFLQKIVHSLTNAPILQREGQNDFYSQLYVTALDLFKKNNQILRNTIENSYKHIFVDEFQDCNRSQYEIVRIMSKWNVRVHMLFDSLQTIFNFDTDHPDYLAFENRCRKLTPDKVFILDIPYRWRNVNSPLEQCVIQWRTMIHDAISKGNKSIDLTKLSGVTYIHGTYNDARIKINSCIRRSGNVLVLHSNYHANNIKARGYVCMGAGYKLRMMESIDNSDFYNLASEIDQLIQDKASVETIVYLVLKKSGVSTTQLNKWIKVNRLVPKQASEEKVVATALSVAVGLQPVKVAIIESIGVITKKIGLPVQRIELLSEILSSISSSMLSGRTVREEVTRKRNIARVQGRKLYGKVSGTTLLTKGLESDTVILIKPSEFFKDADGLKHLYVALTRAVKEIILIDY